MKYLTRICFTVLLGSLTLCAFSYTYIENTNCHEAVIRHCPTGVNPPLPCKKDTLSPGIGLSVDYVDHFNLNKHPVDCKAPGNGVVMIRQDSNGDCYCDYKP